MHFRGMGDILIQKFLFFEGFSQKFFILLHIYTHSFKTCKTQDYLPLSKWNNKI